MKNKIFVFGILCACIIFISGCSNGNFFNIQSVMNPPKVSSEQEEIQNAIKDYIGLDVKWESPLFEGKYSTAIKADLTGKGEDWRVAFCKTFGEAQKIHIIFLKQNEGKWKILEDITHSGLDIEKVYIKDINKDGKNEIVIFIKNFDGFYKSVYAYECDSERVFEVSLPDDFLV